MAASGECVVCRNYLEKILLKNLKILNCRKLMSAGSGNIGNLVTNKILSNINNEHLEETGGTATNACVSNEIEKLCHKVHK